jgi:O-antigen ligase
MSGALGLIALLLLATLGEGGGHPISIVAWHGWLVVLVVVRACRPRETAGSWCHPGLVPFGLFLLLLALGAARAPYSYAALLLVLELASCVAVAWIAAGIGPRLLPTLARSILAGAALQGVYVIVQAWRHGGPREAGTFLNANHLGLWLVAALLLGLGSTEAWGGRKAAAWNLGLALPAAAAIGLAGSRGAAVALIAGGMTLLLIHRHRMGRGTRLALLSAVVVIVALVAWKQLARIEQDPFRHQRVKIWKASIGAVVADPWWGSGPGQFRTAARNLSFPDGDGPLRYDRAFSATHSDAFRLPAEFGIPAALAAVAALLLAARGLARRRRNGELGGWTDGAIAALVAIGAQALVDNPSRWPAVYLLASALLGCMLPTARGSGARIGRGLRAAFAAGLVLIFFVADLAPFLAWAELAELPRGRLDVSQYARLERALRWNPLQPEHWLRLAEHHDREPGSRELGAYAAAREAAEHAVRLDPKSSRYQRGLAEIEARGCRSLFPNAACRARVAARFRRAEELARYDPFVSIALSMFLVDMGDPAAARRAAERALALEPEAVLPRLVLVDAMLDSGSADGLVRAAAVFEDARERASRWSTWKENDYGRKLLVPDPRHFERLERKLARASTAATSAGSGAE